MKIVIHIALHQCVHENVKELFMLSKRRPTVTLQSFIGCSSATDCDQLKIASYLEK